MPILEHTFKIRMVPGYQLFCNKRKFKRLNMVTLSDTIRIKKERIYLMIYSLTPFDINFHTILMSKVILAKYLSKKAGPLEPFVCSRILVLGLSNEHIRFLFYKCVSNSLVGFLR